MIALPVELEQQVIQFAQFQSIDPITLLKNAVADYISRDNKENIYLAKLADDVTALGEPSLSQEEAMRMLDDLVN